MSAVNNKRSRRKKRKESDQLWISPHLALRGVGHQRRVDSEPSNARILELADIALGFKDPEPARRQTIVDRNTETETPRLLGEFQPAEPVLVMDDLSRYFCCPICKARFARNASDAIELFRVHRCVKASAA